jgi:hypothetical protein
MDRVVAPEVSRQVEFSEIVDRRSSSKSSADAVENVLGGSVHQLADNRRADSMIKRLHSDTKMSRRGTAV